DVGVQAGPLAARAGAAVVLGVVAAPFAALVPLLNMGTDEATGCSSLLAAANADPKAPAPGETAKDGAQSGDAVPDKQAGQAASQNKGARGADEANRENWPSMQSNP